MEHRAFDALTQRYWAIQPDALNLMAQIAMRQNDKEAWEAIKKNDPAAVQGKIVPRMQGTARATLRGRVAVLPLTGPIFPRANMMTEMSGATSLSIFSHDFETVLNDDGVDAILLDIDSPGGVAFGPGEMADIIAAGREIKPIVAYVSGVAASAAYWIASACSEIVAHRSAELGSIGVVAGVPVQEEPDSQGYRVIEIVSSNAKNKRPDPRTDDGAAEIRSSLDGIEEEFIGAVARYRGISSDDVKTKFGQGGVMIASRAVAAGMADRLGSFEETLSALQNSSQTKKGSIMSEKEKKTEEAAKTMTAESLRQSHPAIAETLRKEGHDAGLSEGRKDGIKEGAEAERARIAGIDSLARAGREELIASAKADGVSTKADVAIKLAEADAKFGTSYLDSLEKESAASPDIAPSADTGGKKAEIAADAPIEERAKAEWDNKPESRKGFPSFKAFLGAKKAEESGRGRVTAKKAA